MEIDAVIRQMTLEEKASLCSGMDFWHTKEVERLGIPSEMLCDGPNGLRKQEDKADHMGINESIQAVCFPTASAVAASFDRKLAGKIGKTLGRECQAEGVSMLLGPGVNIKRSPLCGRNFEYYSEDPYQSSEMAAAYIKGLQSMEVGACIKHFSANNQETRRQSGDSVMDERTLHEIYLASFEQAVKEGKPAGVMCSYNRVNGTFASENKELLTDILRARWGYDGIVVTDWGAVKDRVKGLGAGLDLEMPGGDGSRANDMRIVKAVRDGILPESTLDETVLHILQFIDKYRPGRHPEAVFDREEDYQTALEAAKECGVLLKNECGLLPLEQGTKAAFIGGFIESPRIQGSGSSYIHSARIPSILDCIQGMENVSYAKGFDVASDETDEAALAEAVELAGKCEVAVIFAGLPGRSEAEGADRLHLELPPNQNRLIVAIKAVQPRTIVVLSNGAPVTMPWAAQIPAILEMYLAGDGSSEAAMSLLYGKTNPSGKLAETFPLRLEDTPSFLNFPGEKGRAEYHEGVFVGYRYYDKKKMDVLFPFGHGLSYTTFRYTGCVLSEDHIRDTDRVTVSVTVENTGKRAGKEVVQLYTGQCGSTIRRPVRELKGFEKIELQPGSKKTIQFTLDKSAFAYYETAIHDWYVESGQYEISIGSSSRDIRCKTQLYIEASQPLPIEVSAETSIGDLLGHPKTAAAIQKIFGNLLGKAADEADSGSSSMGEGAGNLMQGAMEMPIGALESFGVLTREQLDTFLDSLRS